MIVKYIEERNKKIRESIHVHELSTPFEKYTKKRVW